MDANPRICLSLLYKNDPFYSCCLSDLMAAPQRVKNKFLKEQRNLTMTLKKLEHQKLTRLRQLNEEQKQFGLLMKRKLVPRASVKRGSALAAERGSPRTLSSVNFSLRASSKSSWKSFDTKLCTKPDAGRTSVAAPAPDTVQTPMLHSKLRA
ncbi:hypothetical protein lerEdw1_003519, partial [Lerista edwardsae]